MEQEKILNQNEWRKSVMYLSTNEKWIFKSSNYRGIKLLLHTMKVWERIVESRLRKETRISEE